MKGTSLRDSGRCFVITHPQIWSVQVRSAIHRSASVAEIYRAFGVLRKAREKLLTHWDHFMALVTETSDFPSNEKIFTLTKRTSKRITRQRSGWGLVPSHDHAGIESTSQRHPDSLPTIKVSRQIAFRSEE